ncbi:MAG: PTS galactosamine transporter subunit IIB [Erysipelotrichaceae bacterium]
MPANIVLTRIDNRLVHGQVGNIWVSSCGCNLILVVDDKAANDPIQQSLMKMTAEAAHVGIRFFTVEKTIEIIDKAKPTQLLFIIGRTPDTICRLMEGGVQIKKVNVGNMHYQDGKTIYKERHVYVDQKDLDTLTKIKNMGAEVYLQFSPEDHKYEF